MGCANSSNHQDANAIQPVSKPTLNDAQQQQLKFEKSVSNHDSALAGNSWDNNIIGRNDNSLYNKQGTTVGNLDNSSIQHNFTIHEDGLSHKNINKQITINNVDTSITGNKHIRNISTQRDAHQELWDMNGDNRIDNTHNNISSIQTSNKKNIQRNQNNVNTNTTNNNQHLQSPNKNNRNDLGAQDLAYYDELMFVEQAISQSLQDGQHHVNDDQEFEKIMQQVLKDSKVDHEIKARKEKEEELQLISQIPELRQQKIQQILNQADQQKMHSKLQPLQPLGGGKGGHLAPLPLNFTSNQSQSTGTGGNSKKDQVDLTRSSISVYDNDIKQANNNQNQDWQNNNNNSTNNTIQNNMPLPQINVKVINYDKSKDTKQGGKNKLDIFDDQTWAHNGMKENFDLEGSIDLDEFNLDSKNSTNPYQNNNNNNSKIVNGKSQPFKNNNTLNNNGGINSISKPSLLTTMTFDDKVNMKNEYHQDELDLDELKAFLDDGSKYGKKQSPKLPSKNIQIHNQSMKQSQVNKQLNMGTAVNSKHTLLNNNDDNFDEDFF